MTHFTLESLTHIYSCSIIHLTIFIVCVIFLFHTYSHTHSFIFITDQYFSFFTFDCIHISGDYYEGIKYFNSILDKEIHHVWFRREMAYYYLYRENKSLKTYNYDDDLHLKLKYGMSQHDNFVIPNSTEYTSYKKYAKEVEKYEREQFGSIDKRSKEEIEQDKIDGYDTVLSILPISEGKEYEKAREIIEEKEKTHNLKIEYLLKATSGIGKLIQLNHPGFLPNQRQHRQFGLAVLQLAQSINEHVTLRHDSNNKVCVRIMCLCVCCLSVVYVCVLSYYITMCESKTKV